MTGVQTCALPIFYNDLGLFIQDRWKLNKMTIGLALRYDTFQASFPDQKVGPSNLTPGRNFTFPAQSNLDWNDITYRSSLAYDINGDGKTAIKVTLNKYLLGQTLNGLGTDPNPVNTMVTSATRNWTDANGNYKVDCDLQNFAANAECAGISNPTFGLAAPASTFSKDLRSGFNHRQSNWEFSAGVQREVLPRVSVDVGYFRRIWENFRVTDDLNLSASDFDTFSMTVPSDPRLPRGGGYKLDGLVALKPEAFGRPAQNDNRLDSVYGSQLEHWNGVDVNVDARLPFGLTLQAGTSTGRTSEND